MSRRDWLIGAIVGVACAVVVLAPPPRSAIAAEPQPLPSGLDELGSASPQDVSRALRKVRLRYGDDAIVIETQLLLNAMRNGSLRATEVGVEGIRTHEDKKYLVFNVDTGLVFDSATRDETTRVHMLWETIMAPTLDHLSQGLRVPADGIKVAMRYHHRPYRTVAELRAHLDEPGTAEEAAFYVLAPDVDRLLGRTETPHSLIARAHVTVNGSVRTLPVAPADLPTAPGPE